jgi:hypothetical protein
MLNARAWMIRPAFGYATGPDPSHLAYILGFIVYTCSLSRNEVDDDGAIAISTALKASLSK